MKNKPYTEGGFQPMEPLSILSLSRFSAMSEFPHNKWDVFLDFPNGLVDLLSFGRVLWVFKLRHFCFFCDECCKSSFSHGNSLFMFMHFNKPSYVEHFSASSFSGGLLTAEMMQPYALFMTASFLIVWLNLC